MLFRLDACNYAFKIQGYSDIECYSDTSSLEPAVWIVFIQLAHYWTPRPKHTRYQNVTAIKLSLVNHVIQINYCRSFDSYMEFGNFEYFYYLYTVNLLCVNHIGLIVNEWNKTII